LRFSIIIFFVAFFFTGWASCYANDEVVADSAIVKKAVETKPTADTADLVRIKHSPARAALLSAVLPGLGQIYNQKGWMVKVPIIYAALGTSVYFFATNQKMYKIYMQGYVDYTNATDKTKALADAQKLPLLSRVDATNVVPALDWYVNSYRRWRDWSVFSIAGFYVLNIIDATVYGYLFDYDISENLTLKVEPSYIRTLNTSNAYGLRLTFNLHK
jgi:hypothetical protein